MRKTVLSAVAIALCVGCGTSGSTGPDQGAAGSSCTTTTGITEVKNMETERESHLRENIVSIAGEEFPDDTGLEWVIHGFEHKDHLTFVEVEPRPDTVGYPRFKFVVSFTDANVPIVVATYSLEDDRYTLLCLIENSTDDLPEVLPRSDDASN